MSNLLEKASILTTPTAYDNGKILSVKPAPSLSSELMPSTATIANLGGGSITQITENIYSSTSDGTSGSAVRPKFDFNTTSGKIYKLVITPIGTITGTINFDFYDGSTYLFQDYDFTTIKEITFKDNGTVFGAFNGQLAYSISNFKVSVKEEIDGDFDFTRNSSATRVNSQGLIEDMQILSSNLVSNGDFSQEGSELVTNGDFATDSDWNKINSTVSGGTGNLDGDGQTSLLYQNILTNGKTYKVTFTVSDYNSLGEARIIESSGSAIYTITSNGTFTFTFTHSDADGNFLFRARTGAIFSVDNVSVKEVGQNWTLGTGWSIGANKAVFSDTISPANIRTSSTVFTANKKYQIKLTVADLTSGTAFFALGDGAANNLANYANYANGEHTFNVTAPIGQELRIYSTTSSGSSYSITNITILEITDDTNLPRIDYTGGVGHWLFEPQSTNLVTYSEDFSQWNTSVINVPTLVNEINPSGENQCGFIDVNNSASSVKFTYLVYSTTSNIHTQSVFIKYHSRQWFQLAGGSSSHYANFDVQNGVIGSVGDCTATIEDYGNGWYRCTATTTNTVAPTNYAIVIIDNGTATRLPNSTGIGSYYVWGAQLEQNSFATSYIPTNGSTVTRLADAAFGAGSSDLINSTEGVLYAEIAALANENLQRILSISDGTHNNCVKLGFLNSATDYRIFADVRLASVNQAFLTFNFGAVAPTFKKCAIKYKQNDFALWIDGVEVATDTSGNTFPSDTLNKLSFDRGDGAQDFFSKTKCVAVFKEALTDAELTCLTTI